MLRGAGAGLGWCSAHYVIFAVLPSSTRGAPPFKLCGNYCGKGWCSGLQVTEEECPFEAAPVGCTDRCCREHDYCCSGLGPTGLNISGCNRAINRCIDACDAGDGEQCLVGTFPVPPQMVTFAFHLLDDYCCGGPCHGSSSNSTFPFDFPERIVDRYDRGIESRVRADWQTRELDVGIFVTVVLVGLLHVAWLGAYVRCKSHWRDAVSAINASPSAVAQDASERKQLDQYCETEDSVGLSACGLGYTLPSGKQILNDIHFQTHPGEMTALMGPSGSGKTTFLDVLANRRLRGTTAGQVYVNGIPRTMARGLELFNARVAYMLQLAAAYSPELTCRENLMLAAFLRLPGIPVRQQADRVAMVLRTVGLSECADVTVGGATGGGISGGQKRKLSLAAEMLGVPSLLLLDEPTSGLDSKCALEVMLAVRAFCDTGRSAVVTIHQPRNDIFALFDKVTVLFRGSIAMYSSPTEAVESVVRMSAPAKWTPPPTSKNPADLLLDFMEQPLPDAPAASNLALGDLAVEARSEATKSVAQAIEKFHSKWLHSNVQELGTSSGPNLIVRLKQGFRAVWVLELRELMCGSFASLHQVTIQLVAGAVLLGIIFHNTASLQNAISCAFLTMITPSMLVPFACIASVYHDPGSVYDIELSANLYASSAYLIQKVLHWAVFSTAGSVAFILTLYWLVFGDRGSWTDVSYTAVIVTIEVFNQLAFTLVISVGMMRVGGKFNAVYSLVSGVIVLMQAFSGVLVTWAVCPWPFKLIFFISSMFQTVPSCMRVLLSTFVISGDDCGTSDTACSVFRAGWQVRITEFQLSPLFHVLAHPAPVPWFPACARMAQDTFANDK